MKETAKNNIHSVFMVALMVVSLTIALNAFVGVIRAVESPESAEPSCGVGREIAETIECTELTKTETQRRYVLTDDERHVVENVVMGEAEGESYNGKILVAQCIFNACLKDDITPSEVVEKYKYAGWNDEPSNDVVQAVSDVFDDGVQVTDEFILYFYAPEYCVSDFHESQRYILTEGGHKFFAEW